MFDKKEIISQETVKDFIEGRSDLMDEDTKNTGSTNLIKFIRHNAANVNSINEILLGHQWITTSQFLQDLSNKMQAHELEEFFDKCADGFLGEAIHTAYELERIAKAFPSKISEIADFIRRDEETRTRLEQNFVTQENVFNRIAKTYPELDLGIVAGPKNG